MAIRKCWASKVESIRDTNTDSTDDDSGWLVAKPAADSLLFYDEFCPKYSWVAAGGAATDGSYGNVATADANNANPLGDTNMAVSLRQFAFNDAAASQTAGFFYHCEVDVCLNSAPCTLASLSCAAPVDNATPSRKRRSIIVSSELQRERRATSPEDAREIASDGIKVSDFGCLKQGQTILIEDDIKVCREVRAGSNANAAALSILTGSLLCALH